MKKNYKTSLVLGIVCAAIITISATRESTSSALFADNVEALANREAINPDNWGEHCRCKYGHCRPGNMLSFRKYCTGPEPGDFVDCTLYNGGCE